MFYRSSSKEDLSIQIYVVVLVCLFRATTRYLRVLKDVDHNKRENAISLHAVNLLVDLLQYFILDLNIIMKIIFEIQ